MLRVVVMVSGGGTNLQAILDAVDNGKITNAEVVAVISNNEGAYAIERAKNHGVPAFVVTPKAYETRDAFNEALLETIKACKPDLIVLAGFLVKIPAAMIEAYRNKIINIHPSLIPSFCGVGYYGLKVHEAALARGVRKPDNEMAEARQRFDWDAQFRLAIDGEKAKAYYESVPASDKHSCSMCGKMCAVRSTNRILYGESVEILQNETKK